MEAKKVMGLSGIKQTDWATECKCWKCGPIKDQNIIYDGEHRPTCPNCGECVKLLPDYNRRKVMTLTQKLDHIRYVKMMQPNPRIHNQTRGNPFKIPVDVLMETYKRGENTNLV